MARQDGAVDGDDVEHLANRGPLAGCLAEEVQTFRSFGAHGVAHITSEGSHYLAVSMYYADFVADTVVGRFSRFEEHQRLAVRGRRRHLCVCCGWSAPISRGGVRQEGREFIWT